MKRYVIFTDLDGTLLDCDNYSFAPAIPALRFIEERKIPLVFCSSKTRREIERYREKLGNRDPFIVENGGGIFIPADYFGPPILRYYGLCASTEGGYEVISLGASYQTLRCAVRELRDEGFRITGFGDMTSREVAAVSGLSEEEAMLAKKREFDEPFLFEGNGTEEMELEKAVRAKGFNLTRGRFFHILGESNKGKAVTILTTLYRQMSGDIDTIALGDSPNDISMLEQVDHPILVNKPDGRHDPRIRVPRLIRTERVGPAGWNEAICILLSIA